MNSKGQVGVYWGVFGVVMFLVLLVLLLGYDTVEPSHMGVKVRFGTILGPMQPGMQWTGMFTHVEEYDMRIRKDTIILECKGTDCSNAAATKDGQAVYATINVNYRVKNDENTVMNLFKQVGTNSQIDDKLNIQAIITEGFKQTTVKYDWNGILDNREKVKEEAIVAIRTNFPKDYFEIPEGGIVVTNIGFSPAFQSEIESKMIAQQAALKEQNNLEKVKFEQQQQIEIYKADAEKMRLQKSEITAQLNQQAWIAKWDGKLPTYMIASSDSMSNLLQLPMGIADTTKGVQDAKP
jgi:regulator of protease activity HflC (stomatin/prohibitin superfamily)